MLIALGGTASAEEKRPSDAAKKGSDKKVLVGNEMQVEGKVLRPSVILVTPRPRGSWMSTAVPSCSFRRS